MIEFSLITDKRPCVERTNQLRRSWRDEKQIAKEKGVALNSCDESWIKDLDREPKQKRVNH